MISLREQLSRRPGGSVREPLLGWNEVSQYIREGYTANPDEKARREKAATRQRFYQCRGDAEMLEMLQKVFVNRDVIELRRQWIEFAKYNNVIRRVVGELATVYSQPAIRKVDGEENDAAYQEVQRLSRQTEVMQRINRMAVLHRALAVGPRMRQSPSGQWEPVIDVVTPAKFHAVRDPLDPTQLAALVFENDYALASSMSAGPRWSIVGWHETMFMSSSGEILESSIVEHGYGRIPWILLTLDPPDGELLDQDTGEDLVAAQKAIWFLNVLHLKESKSATKQTIVQGDTSQAVRGQVNDTDATGMLPEGVTVSQYDRSMDVSIFPKGAEHIADSVGANFGLSPSVRRGDSVASADARDLQRIPLRETRLQQHVPFRQFERELAEVQSLVIGKYAAQRPDLQFTTAGWSVNFADPQTPLGTKEALEVFEQERRLGLTSTIKEQMKRDPDQDRGDAKEFILDNIVDELWRNTMMRPLQAISGSPAADGPGGDIPGEPNDGDAEEEAA